MIRAAIQALLDQSRAVTAGLEMLLAETAPVPNPTPAPNPTLSPTPAGWKLLMDVNFKTGAPGGIYQQATNTDKTGVSRNRMIPVMLPWDATRQGVRFEIVPGDKWNGKNAYPRAEFLIQDGPNELEYGKEYAFELEACFTGRVSNGKEMLGPFQIHHDGGGTIPIAMYFKDGGLKLAVRKNITSPTWYTVLPSVEAGRKYRFRLELKGDKGTAGYVRVFVDDVLKAEHKGQIGYIDERRVGQGKSGLYDYGNTIPDGMTMISDGLRWYVKS
jgi:Polysaccharide lyase